MLSELTTSDIFWLAVGAMGIGFSKAGFPGVSMLHVVLYALIFGPLESTGVLLPMLVIGDICAIRFFGQKADWGHVRRLLPPTLVGIVIGWLVMGVLDEGLFKFVVAAIILALAGVQTWRLWKPGSFEHFPHASWFAVLLGLLAGLTTMLANAAGPVVALYLLAVNLPKWELIGTSAWLFFVLNVLKLPLSYQLGLISPSTLLIDAAFAPAIPIGMVAGRWLVHRVSQKLFNTILLGFTVIMAIRLMGWF